MQTPEGRNRPLHTARCFSVLLLSWLLAVSAGCSTLTSTPSISADASAGWALLPINNLSETPQADIQVQIMIETHLRSRGLEDVAAYTPMQAVSLRSLLDPSTQMNEAIAWARESGYRYGLTGTINEWNYRTGADKEPVVGLNLKLLDVVSGKVLWQANGSRTGWGYANLAAVGESVIVELLENITFGNTAHDVSR